jgi:Helix-turn-helix family
MSTARELWHRIETLHAVTYFAPESRDAARDAGLRGFWMGYFGFRAAPLGAVDAATVSDAFDNFAPTMVARSIPDAWSYATPDDLLSSRSSASATALRRLVPAIESASGDLNPLLERIVAEAAGDDLVLFAANVALPGDPDPVARCWQLCTTLREHRGDGHVRALRAARVGGCRSHVLHVADRGLPIEVLRDNRGWTQDEWDGEVDQLTTRGLVDAGGLTPVGARLRTGVEDETDRHAGAAIAAALDAAEQRRLVGWLTPLAEHVAGSGIIPFPNPMGLPGPG